MKVWDCSLQCYDQRLITTGGSAVEGQYTWLSFLPFEDKGHNTELDNFLQYDKKPDAFGAQAWVAGQVFATAVNSVMAKSGPNGLTRSALLTAIRGITNFDDNGFIAPTNIGGKIGEQVPDRDAGAERQVRARRPDDAGPVRLHRRRALDHPRPGEGVQADERPVVKTRSNLLVLAAAAVLAVGVSWSTCGRTPLHANVLVDLLIFALPLAGIYAMSATGLVVVYTTTGIFNFAQGAIGMFLAHVDWELTVDHGVPQLIAVPLTVLVIAPLIGIGLDRAIMRHLQGKELVVQLLVTVGLMFAFIGLANMIWDQNLSHTLPPLFGNGGFHVAGVVIRGPAPSPIVLAVALAVGLRILLFRTRLGVSMRAVVDNLVGSPASRAPGRSWCRASRGRSAARWPRPAGILLAPDSGMSTSGPLTLLIITVFAAAAVGRIRSLPLTYARRGADPQVGACSGRSRSWHSAAGG